MVNVSATRDLSFTKLVGGSMGDRSKAYAFTITLTAANGTPFAGEVVCERGGATETLTFTGGSATVRLEHEETILLKDLSGNLSYTIEESVIDAGGYVTTYTVNDAAAASSRTLTGNLSESQVVVCQNTRNVVIPSGVFGSAAAFLVAAPAFLAGTLAFRRTKRR